MKALTSANRSDNLPLACSRHKNINGAVERTLRRALSSVRRAPSPPRSLANPFLRCEPAPSRCRHVTRKSTRALLLSSLLLNAACGVSQKLSHDKAREKIQELGLIQFKNQEVQVKEIVQSGKDQAIAEANLSISFRLSKAKGGDWQVSAVRLGDRNWLDIKSLLSALDEVRARETRENLTKLLNGLRLFKEKNGRYPQVVNITELTDALVPGFVSEMIRYDAWNRELVFSLVSPDSFQLISLGADGIRGTADDIVLTP